MKKNAKEKKQKKKKSDGLSTHDLMEISDITDYSIATKLGELVFFIIKPTNISVLPDASVSARIEALLNVIKGQTDIEMLALNSTESFESNKSFYRVRIENEELFAIRQLLEQDSNHLDRIQVLTASAREFYLIVRLYTAKEHEIHQNLSGLEKVIKDNGFITRRAGEQDLKRMLAVYYEQNVTSEHYPDFDGDHWLNADK